MCTAVACPGREDCGAIRERAEDVHRPPVDGCSPSHAEFDVSRSMLRRDELPERMSRGDPGDADLIEKSVS